MPPHGEGQRPAPPVPIGGEGVPIGGGGADAGSGAGEAEGKVLPENGFWRPRPLAGGLLLLAYAAVIAARGPRIVLEGRLYAEEALAVGLSRVLDAMTFLLHEGGGYYNGICNLATFAAGRLVPLEHAPRITVAVALAVQVLPAAVLLYAHIPAFRRPLFRVLAAFVPLLYLPSADVWLTSLTSHYHLVITAGLLLVARTPRGRAGRWCSRAALFVAAISGPLSLLLLPFFVLTAWRERDRERWAQIATLLAGAGVQVLVLALAEQVWERHLAVDLQPLPYALFVKGVMYPLAGHAFTVEHSSTLARAIREHQPVGLPVLVCLATFAAAIAAAAASRRREAVQLVLAGLGLAVVGYAGSLFAHQRDFLVDHVVGHVHARYYYGPMVLFWLGLLAAAAPLSRLPRAARAVLLGLLLWLSAVGGYHYVKSVEMFPWAFTGPRWSAEIARWRADPDHMVRIWPAPHVQGFPR